MKNFLLFVFLAMIGINSFGQNKQAVKVPIVNGKATYLPAPDYSQKSKDLCASGQVEVEVLINEEGDVIEAKAISGDELLKDSAVQAAKKAKFSQTFDLPLIKTKGIIAYNFPSEKKCVEKGTLNSLAKYLPFPKMTIEASRACVGGKVEVVVLIDSTMGKVMFAKAILGNEFLRKSSEEAALEAEFPTSIDNFSGIYVRGKLVYEFPQPKCISGGTLNEKALNIPKPQIENAIYLKYIKPKREQTVAVRVEVDENGSVVSAVGVSGHPLLRFACEVSARQAKFNPVLVSNSPVSFTGIIVYKFKPDGTIEF